MIRFDETTRTLSLGVHDLLSAPLSPSGAEPAGGSLRAQIGAQAHSRELGAAADPHVRTEVALALDFTRRDCRIRIDGRADLVRLDPLTGACEVEEIKSLLLPGVRPEDWQLDPAHAEQACFYGLFLARAGTPVRACRVRYVDPAGTHSRLFDAGFDEDRADTLLLERIDLLLDGVEVESGRRRERRALAAALPFPHGRLREPQTILVRDIGSACAAGGAMLCSAPTGTGKTAGALFPVLKRALESDGVVFFLTSRVSQQELALRTLAAMLPTPGPALAVQITAKDRSCPFEDWQCVEDRCPHLEKFRARLEESGLAESLAAASVLSGAAITRESLRAGLCPFETTLALARRATVLVADYNYVFHPGVALRLLLDVRDRPLYLVVDEAHNLPGRVADYHSPRLDAAALDRLATVCLGAPADALRETGALLADIARHHRQTWKTLAEENPGLVRINAEVDRAFFEDVQVRAEPLLASCFLALAGRPPLFAREARAAGQTGRRRLDPLLDALYTLRTFCACAAAPPDLFANLWDPDGVRLLCLNPAAFIRAQTDRFAFSLFMSATLTPFSYSARMLGVEESAAVTLELPSPFPPENRLLLAVPTVETAYRARERDAEAIATLIREAMALRPGNYLAFFPSFAFRDMVIGHFPAAEKAGVILQTPAMPAEPVLRKLRANTGGTLLLAAVQGGVFAEGVDYPGHLALGAFIVGPGLPMVSPEQKMLESYFEAHDGKGKGFDLACVTPGMIRAVQAGGRVIRSETDAGFVMLIGKRFQHKLYRGKFPQFWARELIDTEEPLPAIRAFWERVDHAAAVKP